MSGQDGEGAIVGYATTGADMRQLGFIPLELLFRFTTVELPDGPACEWTTVGDLPKGPGLYAFTIGLDGDEGPFAER